MCIFACICACNVCRISVDRRHVCLFVLFFSFEECKFYLPEDGGVKTTTKVNMAEHLRIAVHFGPREEIIAMASINMDDLDSLVSQFSMS